MKVPFFGIKSDILRFFPELVTLFPFPRYSNTSLFKEAAQLLLPIRDI